MSAEEPAAKRRKIHVETFSDAYDGIVKGKPIFNRDVLKRVLRIRFNCTTLCEEFEGFSNFRVRYGDITLEDYLKLVRPDAHGLLAADFTDAVGADGTYSLKAFTNFMCAYYELPSTPLNTEMVDEYIVAVHAKWTALVSVFLTHEYNRTAERFLALFGDTMDWKEYAPKERETLSFPWFGNYEISRRILHACPERVFQRSPLHLSKAMMRPLFGFNMVERCVRGLRDFRQATRAFSLLADRAGWDGTLIPFALSDESILETVEAPASQPYRACCDSFHFYTTKLEQYVVNDCEDVLPIKNLRLLVASYLPIFPLLYRKPH